MLGSVGLLKGTSAVSRRQTGISPSTGPHSLLGSQAMSLWTELPAHLSQVSTTKTLHLERRSVRASSIERRHGRAWLDVSDKGFAMSAWSLTHHVWTHSPSYSTYPPALVSVPFHNTLFHFSEVAVSCSGPSKCETQAAPPAKPQRHRSLHTSRPALTSACQAWTRFPECRWTISGWRTATAPKSWIEIRKKAELLSPCSLCPYLQPILRERSYFCLGIWKVF